jgi:hypothetical protein
VDEKDTDEFRRLMVEEGVLIRYYYGFGAFLTGAYRDKLTTGVVEVDIPEPELVQYERSFAEGYVRLAGSSLYYRQFLVPADVLNALSICDSSVQVS